MSNKKDVNWDGIIDGIQRIMIWLVILFTAISIMTLIMFDMLAGAGSMMYLTRENLVASIAISLSTTGLITAQMFVAYRWANAKKNKNKKGFSNKDILGLLLALTSLFSSGLDVYFDSLTADYLRFGSIVSINSLPVDDVHILFRSLIGGISLVGEPLAILMILGMPILKDILANTLPPTQTNKKDGKRNPETKKSRDARHQAMRETNGRINGNTPRQKSRGKQQTNQSNQSFRTTQTYQPTYHPVGMTMEREGERYDQNSTQARNPERFTKR